MTAWVTLNPSLKECFTFLDWANEACSPLHAVESVVYEIVSIKNSLDLVQDLLSGATGWDLGTPSPEAVQRWQEGEKAIKTQLATLQETLRTLDPAHRLLA